MACSIVVADLTIKVVNRGECLLLDTVLSRVFDKKQNYYNKNVGRPDVRIRNVEWFRSTSGFSLLHVYMQRRVMGTAASVDTDTPVMPSVDGVFPTLGTVHHVLEALLDSMTKMASKVGDKTTVEGKLAPALQEIREQDAIQVSQTVMLHLLSLSVDVLKKIQADLLSLTLETLRRIFDHLVTSRRCTCLQFFKF
jgi:hypothetical protein